MPTSRWVQDLGWSTAGVLGAVAGIRAMEALRPEVIADDVTAPENTVGIGELSRAYALAAGAILAGPLLGAGRLPRACGPLGIAVQLGSVGLRVWAMRTLRGHYSHGLRVVDGQPVIRSGPYRFVRHPGYASALLLWLGAAVTARSTAAAALTVAAVGRAYRHRADAEEALLTRELPGYADYAAGTGRLVPRAGALEREPRPGATVRTPPDHG